MNPWSVVAMTGLALLSGVRQEGPLHVHSVNELVARPSGALVAFKADDSLGVLNVKEGRTVAWTDPPKAGYDLPIAWFSDGRHLLFLREGPFTPMNYFIVDAETGEVKPLDIQGVYIVPRHFYLAVLTGSNGMIFVGAKDEKGSQPGVYLARNTGAGWRAEPVLIWEGSERRLISILWAKREGEGFRMIAEEKGVGSDDSWTDCAICAIDVEHGKVTRRLAITPFRPDMGMGYSEVSTDGRWLAIRRMESGPAPSQVLLFDTASRAGAPQTLNLDVHWFRMSPSGKALLLWDSKPARLAVVDTASLRRRALPVPENVGFVQDAAWLSDDEVAVSLPSGGAHIWVLNVETGQARSVWRTSREAKSQGKQASVVSLTLLYIWRS